MKKFRVVSIVIAILMVIFMLTSCSKSDSSSRGPFDTSALPLAVTGSNGPYGSFTFDGDGNLLFDVNDANEIRSLNRYTGAVTTVATGVSVGYTLIGMTYYNGFIYVGDDDGNIFKVDPSTGSSTFLVNMGSGNDVNGLAIAPSTFGTYGGQLIVATDENGSIYAVDQSQASPTPVLIASISAGSASALIFGSDGTLYAAAYSYGKIVTVTAAGIVADFATGLNAPDGLAIDDNGGFLYVADSSDDAIYNVTIPGEVVSSIASVTFGGGFWPSAMIYDETSNILLFGSGSIDLTIDYLSF
jgi:sugar lactone lactonase YvrE